jgi:hypothetical protein
MDLKRLGALSPYNGIIVGLFIGVSLTLILIAAVHYQNPGVWPGAEKGILAVLAVIGVLAILTLPSSRGRKPHFLLETVFQAAFSAFLLVLLYLAFYPKSDLAWIDVNYFALVVGLLGAVMLWFRRASTVKRGNEHGTNELLALVTVALSCAILILFKTSGLGLLGILLAATGGVAAVALYYLLSDNDLDERHLPRKNGPVRH